MVEYELATPGVRAFDNASAILGEESELYLVLALRQGKTFYFVLRDGRFAEVPTDADGVYRSKVFPGVWLHVSGLATSDAPQLAPESRRESGTLSFTSALIFADFPLTHEPKGFKLR